MDLVIRSFVIKAVIKKSSNIYRIMIKFTPDACSVYINKRQKIPMTHSKLICEREIDNVSSKNERRR